MDIFDLAQRLRDPDPRVRVETLRILAMVEETKALSAVRWIYQNDPEPGVREVANWAGNMIWQADQRGHTTERALEQVFQPTLSPERQAMFLSAQETDASRVASPKARKYAVEQAYRRRLAEVLRNEEDLQEDLAALPEGIPALPALVRPTVETEPLTEAPDNIDDLLDAGLTDLLRSDSGG
jgi:hypothetical protein